MLEARFVTSALDLPFAVYHAEGVERLGELYYMDIDVTLEAALDAAQQDALFDAAVALAIDENGITRRFFSGAIASVESLGAHNPTRHVYRLRVVPRLAALGLTSNLDVHLDVDIADIIKRSVELAGLTVDDCCALRFKESYPKREFVVQYKETALAFLQRILEHWGVTMFFEEHEGADIAVFTDSNAGFPDLLEENPPVPLAGTNDGRNVHTFKSKRTPMPRRFVVRDYNYRLPQLDLFATQTADGPGFGGDIIEYGTHFKTPEEGSFFARLRSEEARCRTVRHEGQSGFLEMRAGSKFKLAETPQGDLDLLVVEVKHVIDRSQATGSFSYENSFVALDANVPFRPARTTPIPKVHGVLTGRVEAPSKSNYAEVDEEGRYKVRFLFDTTDRGDAQASRPVRMIQPHAGPGYGMHFPLRAGVEVALTFVDGDPDRPVIVGTVPNPQTQSPVTSDNKTKNVIRTGGGNEIDIDDQEDGHRIKMSTPYMNTIFQIGKNNAREDGAILSTVGNVSTVANTSISTIGSIGTSISLAQKFSTAGDIVTYASKPSAGEIALLTVSLIDTVASIGAASLDIARQVQAVDDGIKQGESGIAEKSAIEAESTVTGNDKAITDAAASSGLPAVELPEDATALEDMKSSIGSESAANQAAFWLAYYNKRRADLEEANTALAEAQEAYNTAVRQKTDGSLSVDATILSKWTDLVAKWKAVVVLEEELDGNTDPPSGAISPTIHTDGNLDVQLKDSTVGTIHTKTTIFDTASAADDTTKKLRDALDAYKSTLANDDPKKTSVDTIKSSLDTLHGKADKPGGTLTDLADKRRDAADKKKSADDSTYRLANGETSKNLAKASMGFTAARTATALVSVIAGLVNLIASTTEQQKTFSSFEAVGKALNKLRTLTFPGPVGDFSRAYIENPNGKPIPPKWPLLKPKTSTVHLLGSEEVLGLYGERMMFGWSPFVTLGSQTMVLVGGTNIGFDDSPDPTSVKLKKKIRAKDANAHSAIILSERAIELRAKHHLTESSKRVITRSSTMDAPFNCASIKVDLTSLPISDPTAPADPPAINPGKFNDAEAYKNDFTEIEQYENERITARISAAGKETSYLELDKEKISLVGKNTVRLAVEEEPKAARGATASVPAGSPKTALVMGLEDAKLTVGADVSLEAKADKDVTLTNGDITLKLGKDGALEIDAKTSITLKVGGASIVIDSNGVKVDGGGGTVTVAKDSIKTSGGSASLNIGPADVASKPMVKAG